MNTREGVTRCSTQMMIMDFTLAEMVEGEGANIKKLSPEMKLKPAPLTVCDRAIEVNFVLATGRIVPMAR